MTPEQIAHELGYGSPPWELAPMHELLGVRTQFSKRMALWDALVTWRPGPVFTMVLPVLPTLERLRDAGARELAHVALGHLGPTRPVLHRRGQRRGITERNIGTIEREADEWALGVLVPQGDLRIAVKHEGISYVGHLAQRYCVTPSVVLEAAALYDLGHLLLRDRERLERFKRTKLYREWQAAQLRDRRVCEDCGGDATLMHHWRYDHYQELRAEDVNALCARCHFNRHYPEAI